MNIINLIKSHFCFKSLRDLTVRVKICNFKCVSIYPSAPARRITNGNFSDPWRGPSYQEPRVAMPRSYQKVINRPTEERPSYMCKSLHMNLPSAENYHNLEHQDFMYNE